MEVMTVRPLPGLVVDTPVAGNTNPRPGQQFWLAATVRNVGDGTAAYRETLRFYLSTGTTITTSDTEVGDVEIEALAAAGRST